MLDLYLPGENGLTITREIHIVEGLDAKILLGMDIAELEGWIFDLDQEEWILPCY